MEQPKRSEACRPAPRAYQGAPTTLRAQGVAHQRRRRDEGAPGNWPGRMRPGEASVERDACPAFRPCCAGSGTAERVRRMRPVRESQAAHEAKGSLARSPMPSRHSRAPCQEQRAGLVSPCGCREIAGCRQPGAIGARACRKAAGSLCRKFQRPPPYPRHGPSIVLPRIREYIPQY